MTAGGGVTALTLASTAAGLVPPYLTIPLSNDVLMPRQLGEPVAYNVVAWYLGGMLCAVSALSFSALHVWLGRQHRFAPAPVQPEASRTGELETS